MLVCNHNQQVCGVAFNKVQNTLVHIIILNMIVPESNF